MAIDIGLHHAIWKNNDSFEAKRLIRLITGIHQDTLQFLELASRGFQLERNLRAEVMLMSPGGSSNILSRNGSPWNHSHAFFSELDVSSRRLKAVNTDKRRYLCRYCRRHCGSYGFKRRDHLIQHVQNYHRHDMDAFLSGNITFIGAACHAVGAGDLNELWKLLTEGPSEQGVLDKRFIFKTGLREVESRRTSSSGSQLYNGYRQDSDDLHASFKPSADTRHSPCTQAPISRNTSTSNLSQSIEDQRGPLVSACGARHDRQLDDMENFRPNGSLYSAKPLKTKGQLQANLDPDGLRPVVPKFSGDNTSVSYITSLVENSQLGSEDETEGSSRPSSEVQRLSSLTMVSEPTGMHSILCRWPTDALQELPHVITPDKFEPNSGQVPETTHKAFEDGSKLVYDQRLDKYGRAIVSLEPVGAASSVLRLENEHQDFERTSYTRGPFESKEPGSESATHPRYPIPIPQFKFERATVPPTNGSLSNDLFSYHYGSAEGPVPSAPVLDGPRVLWGEGQWAIRDFYNLEVPVKDSKIKEAYLVLDKVYKTTEKTPRVVHIDENGYVSYLSYVISSNKD